MCDQQRQRQLSIELKQRQDAMREVQCKEALCRAVYGSSDCDGRRPQADIEVGLLVMSRW